MDCRSQESHLLQAGLRSTGDKRLAIDLSALRQAVWRTQGEDDGDPLYGEKVPETGTTRATWIDTSTMVSDCLTKKMKCKQVEGLMTSVKLHFLMDETVSKRLNGSRLERPRRPEMVVGEKKIMRVRASMSTGGTRHFAACA